MEAINLESSQASIQEKAAENKLKTGKVALSVATCLAISFGVYLMITAGASVLLAIFIEIPVIGSIFKFLLQNAISVAWVAAVLALMLSAFIVYEINKETPAEKSVAFKIAGWILVAVGLAGLLLDLLVFKNIILGDLAYTLIGIMHIWMGKGRR